MYDPNTGMGRQVNNWVDKTAQTMPAFQPMQRQMDQVRAAAMPAVQAVNPAVNPQMPIPPQPLNPMGQRFNDWRTQVQDWRGQRPQFAPGAMERPEQRDAFRGQLQDWRGQRPERPQWGGQPVMANRWPGARPIGGTERGGY